MKSELELKCLEMEQYRLRSPRGTENFQRPLYEGTSIENRTIADLHEDDWRKERPWHGWY